MLIVSNVYDFRFSFKMWALSPAIPQVSCLSHIKIYDSSLQTLPPFSSFHQDDCCTAQLGLLVVHVWCAELCSCDLDAEILTILTASLCLGLQFAPHASGCNTAVCALQERCFHTEHGQMFSEGNKQTNRELRPITL